MNLGGKLKHVGLELMRNTASSTDKPEAGLFRGIRVRSDDNLTLKLVLLGHKDKPDNIRAVNSAVFNVMTITLVYGQTKEMIVFKNTEDDQKLAYGMLDDVVKILKKESMMLTNDPDIVDVTKYDDVPDEFFSAQKESSASASTAKTYNTGTNYNTGGQTDWQKKQEQEKKEKERQEKLRWTPFTFSRKTEKPQLKDLNAMKKKIAAIAAGEFERAMPIPKCDAEEENKDDKKTVGA